MEAKQLLRATVLIDILAEALSLTVTEKTGMAENHEKLQLE